MSSFDLKQIEIKLKFESAKVILLSEVCHVRSKSNHANIIKKTFAKASEKYVTRANAVSERKKSLRKFDFFSVAV